MAAKNVDIRINTTADTQGAKQATVAMQGLNTATKQTSATINTTTANTGRMGQVAQGAGYQIQDFAVQVGGGTNALVAFSQQAPQFLGMFGPTGAIAGALLAVGAIAAKVFIGMGEDASAASEKATILEEAIKKIAEEAGKIKSDEIDLGRDAIEQAIELTKLLAEGFKSASEQERQFSQQAVEGVNKLKLAEIALREARGEITGDQATAEKTLAGQQLVLDVADQQKKKEEEKRIAAEETLNIARQEVITKGQSLIAGQEELDLEIQKLETLKQQKAELEKQSKEAVYTASGDADILSPTPAAFEAQKTLASTPFDAQMEALRASIESLSKATDETLYKDLVKAAVDLGNAQVSVNNIAAAVSGQIEQIGLKAQEQLIIENTSVIEAQQKANSDLLKETFANIEPLNRAQQEGLFLIDQATADGKILAAESLDVQKGIALVMSSASAQQKISIGNVNKLLALMDGFGADLLKQQKQIESLQQKYPGIIK